MNPASFKMIEATIERRKTNSMCGINVCRILTTLSLMLKTERLDNSSEELRRELIEFY